MVAAAKDVLAEAVGVVFLANTLPSFLCKLTMPYWFHLVGYPTRMAVGCLLMTAALLLVAVGIRSHSLGLSLLGVAACSLQARWRRGDRARARTVT